MKTRHNRSCPSSTAHPGATLLGMVNENGSVGFIETPITIDETFLQTAGEGIDLEKNFRFSSRCVQNGCQQWENGNCTVIQKIIAAAPDWHSQQPKLPACSIRSTCRWFAQEGAKACSYCVYITTNSMA